MKLIVFQIEGSPLTMRDLNKACYEELISNHFPEFSSYLTDGDVEALIMSTALRKNYGVKVKNPRIMKDETPAALWCWEVQDLSLFEPSPSKAQLNKARTQRAIIGKKVQTLQSCIELCQDHVTFDSEEKIAKLNVEYENYCKLIQKESTSEWNIRKRKREEMELADSSAAQSKTQVKALMSAVKKPHIKYNNEETIEIQVNEASELPTLQERSEMIEPSAVLKLEAVAHVA